ncbi:hypothetical protein ROJ8625_02198 [Roseivivax jejudonensis]|uniref:Type IV pilus biogenesis n=1 Tax=Roseivivax jejudonensis TaxID=1529041 RepID=A0A1X6Z8W4_9RHOB|nr:hypothetical protein [Roseivivax jejudonensis]SLN44099.1 hypothetical protein ROJ8625_02198 [Roseivivax jejudonensis]
MKTDYALNLSASGIALLQRARRGWVVAGEAALDGDLEAQMAALRDMVATDGNGRAAVKLVIPDDQIKFLRRDDPGEAERIAAASALLEGATPYALDELRQDHAVRGDTLFVSAVAEETLEEAEQFALAYGFAPVCFVGLPRPQKYKGEMFFGAAKSWDGPAPKRDTPIRIYPPEEAWAGPQKAANAPKASDTTTDAPAGSADGTPASPADSQPVATSRTEAKPEARQDETPPEVAVEAVQRAVDQAEHTAPDETAKAETGDRSDATATAPSDRGSQDAQPAADRPSAEPHVEDPAPARTEPARPQTQSTSALVAPAQSVAAGADSSAGHTGEDLSSARTTKQDAPETAPLDAADAPQAEPVASETHESTATRDTPEQKPSATTSTDAPARDASSTRAEPEPATKSSSDAPAPTGTPTIAATSARDAPERTSASSDDTPRAANTPAPDHTSGGEAPAPTDAPAPAAAASATPAFTSIRARREAPAANAGAPKVGAPDTAGATRAAPNRPDPELVQARLRGLVAATPDPEDNPDPHGVAEPASPRIAAQPSPRVAMEKPAPATAASTAGSSGAGDARARIAALRPGREPLSGPAGGAATLDDEAQRMTVFGARQQADGARIGGKPRFLGLMLTALLLVFLAGVAAWASVYLDDGIASFFRSEPSDRTETADGPAPSLPADGAAIGTADDASDAEAADGPVLAALDASPDGAPDDTSAPAAISEPVAPQPAGPDAAEATYAATGIWPLAPTAPLPLGPGTDSVDDVRLLSLEPDVEMQDPVALPSAPGAAERGAPFEALPSPAPADTVFDLDERGLVRATPEGALSPDRVRIFAGRPPAIAPTRRSVLPGDVPLPGDAAALERLQQLRGVRPRIRPVTLIESNERATFRGRSLTELAMLRPQIRPETEKAAAEADVTATAQAISTSRPPIARPRDFDRIVEEARARQRAAPPQDTQVASAGAVAPRTVSPSAPSNASVTQQATVRNALNLRSVNLIGVYGQPSNRRALVRLANGRYEKVKVGDRIDGGRVAAIGDSELRYVKGGRNLTLEMP